MRDPRNRPPNGTSPGRGDPLIIAIPRGGLPRSDFRKKVLASRDRRQVATLARAWLGREPRHGAFVSLCLRARPHPRSHSKDKGARTNERKQTARTHLALILRPSTVVHGAGKNSRTKTQRHKGTKQGGTLRSHECHETMARRSNHVRKNVSGK